MIVLFATIGIRLSSRLVLWTVSHFRTPQARTDVQRVLLVGAGDAAAYLAKRLFQDKEGIRIPMDMWTTTKAYGTAG